MNDLHIVTVATESKYYFPYLIESCKRHGKELEVLGYGEKWNGYNMKYRLMIDYLKKLPNDDIVCFVDGYDVLCVRDLNEMKTIFLEIRNNTNNKIIIAKDNFYFSYISILFFGKCNNYSINSGTYIGYVSDLSEIINKIHESNNKDDEDDQVLMSKYCNNSEKDFYIDINNEFFLVLGYPLEEIYKYISINNNNVIYNSKKPFFIHAAGSGYLDEIIKNLGYNIIPNKIKNEVYNNLYNKIVNLNIIKIMKKIIILIIFFIILCFLIFYISKNYKKIKYKKY
jgi:hypothetical protein